MGEIALVKYKGKKEKLKLNLKYLSEKDIVFNDKKQATMPFIDARKLIGTNPSGFEIIEVDGKKVDPKVMATLDVNFTNMSGVLCTVKYLGNGECPITFNLAYLSKPIAIGADKKASDVPYEDAMRLVNKNPRAFKFDAQTAAPKDPEEEEKTEGHVPPDPPEEKAIPTDFEDQIREHLGGLSSKAKIIQFAEEEYEIFDLKQTTGREELIDQVVADILEKVK